jgi:hypothetical protein
MATRGPAADIVGAVLRGHAPNDRRVLRGGSYNNESRNVRCAVRNRNNPNNRNNNIGFRVVVATFFDRPEVRCAFTGSPPRRKMAGHAPGRAPSSRRGRANSNRPAPWVRPWRGATTTTAAQPPHERSESLRATHAATVGCARTRNSSRVIASGPVHRPARREVIAKQSPWRKFRSSAPAHSASQREATAKQSRDWLNGDCFVAVIAAAQDS